jgi:3-phosphoshikimate 1-carboxyvinyltransferase
MSLPEVIEIVPIPKPVRAKILVPGSKSITNRALILAALAKGETKLKGALWSEDTQIMVEALTKLGFKIRIEKDPSEFCNRTITVIGQGGKVPKGGSRGKPLRLNVGNAGTAARFLMAFVCLGSGVYLLQGVPRMHERPQAALFEAIRKPKLYERLFSIFFPALRKLGYRIEPTNGKLPVYIYGGGPKKGKCLVDIKESSQFASALLLCREAGGWEVDVIGENAEESPYIAMTLKLIEAFREVHGKFQIEPDASSGSYFWAAGTLLAWAFGTEREISVIHWPSSGWQIDALYHDYSSPTVTFKQSTSRRDDLGDSIMTAIALAPLEPQNNPGPKIFTDLGRLRMQECDRVLALRVELTKCGAKVVETGDTLEVFPSSLHGAEIETYNDHRMAMCFAILGLKVPGIKIKNPACVKKTFPNFFQKLAAAPPHGLGAAILDGRTGRALSGEELFAD